MENKENNETNVATVEKPLSVMINDFQKNIYNVLNNCGLPISIVEPVLKSIYSDISLANSQMLMKEQMKYQEQMKEQMKYQEQLKGSAE